MKSRAQLLELAKQVVIPWENFNINAWEQDMGSLARHDIINRIADALEAVQREAVGKRLGDEEFEKLYPLQWNLADVAMAARKAYRAAEHRLLGEDRCKVCDGGIGWSERKTTGEYDPDICRCGEK
jgi:hypothetical protein